MGTPSRSRPPSSGACGTQPRPCCRSRTTTFVQIQSETSVRTLASSHPYDDAEAEVAKAGRRSEDARPISLLSGGEQVVQALVEELSDRLAPAGIEVTEARITHL